MRLKLLVLKIILTSMCHFLSLDVFASEFWNIVQDGDGAGEGFIVPNEMGYLSYSSYLKGQKGVLISVGTFRAFQAAATGEFSHVVLFDYASEVVIFNRMLIEYIKQSRDRIHFLDLMFGTNRVYEKLESNNQSLLINELSLNEKSEQKQFLRKIIELYRDPTTSGANFLTSDVYFQKIKKLASNNKLILVNGSLSGKESLADLSILLKQRQLKVSVLDLSNAKDYIINNKQLVNYYRNLLRLPWAENAQVLWSMPIYLGFVLHESLQMNWAYFANPAMDYIDFIQRLQSYDVKEVSGVYDRLQPKLIEYALPKIYSCPKLFE